MASLTRETTASHSSNYRLDIMPEDRLFSDARLDDLIIVSVISILFHLIILTCFKRYGSDWGGEELCEVAF